MRFEVEIDGRLRQIVVEAVDGAGAAGGRFHVVVDGAPHEVDARRTDLGLSLIYGDGRAVDAAVTARAGGEWLVDLPHVTVSAVIDGRRFRRDPAGDDGAGGAQRLTAPMPGRVVRILVREGDEVQARQGLVVVEAMKMENELTAARAGRVREIAIAEGASVEVGRLLIVVE
jgi:biotin carboxyl carrier protein